MKYHFELRETLRKMKTGLIIATVLYVTSFILGWYIVNAQGIFALELRLGFTNAFAWLHKPFNTISKAIIQFIWRSFSEILESPMRFVDSARERVKGFGDEFRRSWMLRASVALLVLGGLSCYLFSIGIGGMMVLMAFFLYWQHKDRMMKKKGKVPLFPP
jgi:hypothetical protein